jgi:5-methylcytosine-specific restriction endonuclease McrA
MPLVVDHILPRSLGGTSEIGNLAAACYRCNEFKGAPTHAVDPESGDLERLFDPRAQSWRDHFEWTNGGT